MSLIASWPLIDEAISFQSGPNSSAPFPYWCSVLGRTQGRWSSRRGRQYELDQVQAGTVTSTLRNLDAAFDPSNTSSPFYPQVTPYRGYRRRAQLPATVNLLTADQATAFYASKGAYTGTSLPQWVTLGTMFNGATVSIAPFDSTANSYQFALPGGNAGGTINLSGFSIYPPIPEPPAGYHNFQPAVTFQATIQATVSGLTSQCEIGWIDASGNQTMSGQVWNLSSVPTTPTVYSLTTAADRAYVGAFLAVSAGTTSANGTVMVTKFQMELGSTASSWVTPGTWYDIFTGFVERWPQSWTDGGTYGVSQLTCVDAIAYLSQRRLRSPAYMEVLTRNANFLYPLDEGSATTQKVADVAVDLTAQRRALQIVNNGATAPASGTSLTNTGGYVPLGIGGPVWSFTNAVTGTPTGVAYLSNPGPVFGTPSSSYFARTFAFRVTALPTYPNVATLWSVSAGAGWAGVGIDYQGHVMFWQFNGSFVYYTDLPTVGDGGWHLLVLNLNSTTGSGIYLDGQAPAGNRAAPSASDGTFESFGGGPLMTIGGENLVGFNGELALIGEIAGDLSASDFNEIYSTFRYGGSGLGTASSGTRYADILRWAKWAGKSSVDTYTTGECNTFGPSVDLLASATEPGTDGVSACQTVVDTDDGEQFVDRSGVVTFHARRWRFNQNTPAVTFGDGTGEIPYTDCSFGLDPTRLANDAAITQTSTQTTVTVVDTASIATYGDVQLQRNVNDTNTESLNDMAQYLATHYATPVQRLETLRIEPATYTVNGAPSTAAWQACLSLELGTPVAVNRRPPGVPTIGFTGFVEQINWTMDDQGRAVCELQVSPNYDKQFWQLDSTTFSVLGTTTICGY